MLKEGQKKIRMFLYRKVRQPKWNTSLVDYHRFIFIQLQKLKRNRWEEFKAQNGICSVKDEIIDTTIWRLSVLIYEISYN